MSNELVGSVFDTVIKEVCNASHVDFEESGVDQQTLEELRKGWQAKLSSFQVAHFPWDPPQQQAPPPQQQSSIPPPAATVPSNAPQASPSPPENVAGQQPPNDASSHAFSTPAETPGIPTETVSEDVTIKSEGTLSPSTLPPGSSNSAAQRAAQSLQQKYGAAAAHQVQQLQTQSQQSALGVSGQQRPQGEQDTSLPEQDQKPAIQSQPQGSAQAQSQSSVGNAQVDGASDPLTEWRAEAAARREAANRSRAEGGDHALREHVKSRASLMEGGGLLAPYNERYPRANPANPQVAGSDSHVRFSEIELRATPSDSDAANQVTVARYDGGDDDDEDAINSDLDDPDDLADEDPENDESINQVMLCTYDKVQRVKSKWKCTLKDGILASGGKDYVFQKAQGEFEW